MKTFRKPEVHNIITLPDEEQTTAIDKVPVHRKFGEVWIVVFEISVCEQTEIQTNTPITIRFSPPGRSSLIITLKLTTDGYYLSPSTNILFN